MTTKEVFKEITGRFKWYQPRSEQWAFSFKLRFAKGQVKLSTLEKVFAKFGYVQNEVTWKRI